MAHSGRSRLSSFWDQVLYRKDLYFPPSRRTVLWAVAAIVGGFVLWFGVQALSARSALNEAAGQAELLQNQLVAGETDLAAVTLRGLQKASADARDSTDGFMWDLGRKIPGVGGNLRAVQTVSQELDRISTDALPPIVDLAGDLNAKAFTPQDGSVDVDAFVKVQPSIAEAAAQFEQSRAALASVDIDSLIVPLRAPLATVQQKIRTAASTSENASLAAQLLPQLLGADQTQRYLLLVQNNAETRPTGGIAGSFAVIEAKDGDLEMGDQGSAVDFVQADDVEVELSDEESTVFSPTMGSDIRDVNITPHFPRSAAIARQLYEKKFDEDIDGVVTIDPVALSYLLAGLGGVEVNTAVIDQNSVVPALLHQAYVLIEDNEAQDEFFEDVTKEVFDQFKAGAGDQTASLRGLVRGVEENRVAFWSSDKNVQSIVRGTELAGSYPPDRSRPRVGVFFSDAAGSKMEYFLNYSTSVKPERCTDDDAQTIALTTELTSTAPGGLPLFVTGTGDFVDKGSMRLNVRLVSPTGGRFTSVSVNGERVTVYADRWEGRNVSKVEVVLKPGETKTIAANVTSGPDQVRNPVFTTTPGVGSMRNDYEVPSACAD